MGTILTALNKADLKKSFEQSNIAKLVDENPFSRYFRIFGIKDESYGLGRHSFILYGSDELVRNSDIQIEILDVNGQPIITRAVESDSNSPGWRVWFTITEEHTAGPAIITIVGSADLREYGIDSGLRGSEYNVMWNRTIAVNPTLPNRSDIVFQEEPDFTVSETLQTDADNPLKTRSFAQIQFNDLDTYSGFVEAIEVFLLSSGSVAVDADETKWQLLGKSAVTGSEVGINPNSFNFKMAVPTEREDDILTFKTRFLNPFGEYAKVDESGSVYEVTSSATDFAGANTYALSASMVGDGLITGSVYASNARGSGIELAGLTSGYMRSVGYEGFLSASMSLGAPGFMMYSGGVLLGSGDNYDGVGLELVSDNGYLRFSTDPSRFEVVADAFFVGDYDSQYISGADGTIVISSSGFYLDGDGNVYISGSVSASTGLIGGWTIGTGSLYNQGTRLEAENDAGLYIKDAYANNLIAVASKSMHTLGSATDEMVNDSFEHDPGSLWTGSDGYHIGTDSSPLSVVSWSLATVGPVSHSITRRLGTGFELYNASVIGDNTFDIIYPGTDAPIASTSRSLAETSASYLTPNTYELTQIVSASSQAANTWVQGNVVSLAFVAKMSHSLAGAGYDRGFQSQKYKVDYWDSSSSQWVKFIPDGTQEFARYNMAVKYSSIKASAVLPQSTDKLRLVLSGSINPDVEQKTIEYKLDEWFASVRSLLNLGSLTPETPILDSNGVDTYTIKELKVEQPVLAYDTLKSTNVEAYVLTKTNHHATSSLNINGGDIYTSDSQLFETDSGIKLASDLTTADKLIDKDGNVVGISSISEEKGDWPLYNLVLSRKPSGDPDDALYYYAGGTTPVRSNHTGSASGKYEEEPLEVTKTTPDTSAKYPYTEISFDNFRLVQDMPRVELSKDGFLLYQSEVSYIKMTPSDFIIRTPTDGAAGIGNAVSSNMNTTNTAVLGQLAAPSLQPYEAEPTDIGTTPFAGGINEYSMGNHRHDLPFNTLNTVTSEGTFDSISVDALEISGSIIFSGSDFAISGALHISASDDSYFIGGGQLGIGTTSPGKDLHIESTQPTIRLVDSDGTNQLTDILRSGATQYFDTRNNTSNGSFSFRGYNGSTYTQYVFINSSGYVGVGTTNPGALLDVYGSVRTGNINLYNSGTTAILSLTATGADTWQIRNGTITDDLWFRNATTGAVPVVLKGSSGYVGIAITNPTSQLHVSGSSSTRVVIIDGAGNSGLTLASSGTPKAYMWYNAANNYAGVGPGSVANSLFFDIGTSNVGIGTTVTPAKLTVEGDSYFNGDAIFTGTVTAQEFHAEYVSSSIIYESGSTKFGDTLDDIHWRTGSLYVSGSDHHFFGNIGIGTTDKLNTWGEQVVTIQANETSGQSVLELIGNMSSDTLISTITFNNLQSADTTYQQRVAQISAERDGSNNAAKLVFATHDSTTNLPAAMTIDSNQYVGIGTSNPGDYIHVYGSDYPTIRAQSTNTNGGMLYLEDSTSYATMFIQNGDIRINTAATFAMAIKNSNQYIGIGTTNPSTILDIEGTDPVLTINSTAGSQGRIDYQNNGTSKVYTGVVTTTNWGGLPTGTSANDGFTRFDGDRYTFTVAASSHVLTLTSGSYVGIGTTNPVERLDINGTNPRIFLDDSTAPGTTTNRLYSVSGNLYWNGIGLTVSGSLPSPVEGNVIRGDGGTNWETTDSMYIASSSGYVGIGNTDPDDILHIASNSGPNIILNTNTHAVKTGIYLTEGVNSKETGVYLNYDGSANVFGIDIGVSTPVRALTIERDTRHVGIGTTDPSGILHIYSSGSETQFKMQGDITQNSTLYFVTASAGYKGYINYDYNNNSMNFSTNTGGDLVTIDSAGSVGIGTNAKHTAYASTFRTLTIQPDSGDYASILELVGNRNANLGNQNAMIQFWNATGTEAETARITSAQGTNPTSGSLSFSVAGSGALTERMRIVESGYIGIGTSNPIDHLHIETTIGSAGITVSGSNPHLSLDDDGGSDPVILFKQGGSTLWTLRSDKSNSNIFELRNSGGTAVFDVNQSGNIGIGTTNPQSLIHLSGSNGNVQISDTTMILNRYASIYGPSVQFQEGGVRTWDIKVDTSGGDVDSLQFRDATSVRMTLEQGGNVGIGTTTPSAKLHIEATGSALYLNDSANANSSMIVTADNARKVKIGRDTIAVTTLADTATTMYVNPNANTILSVNAGKVGIGTASPQADLHVWGDISGSTLDIAGNTTLSGDIIPSADDTYYLGSSTNRWADIYATQTTTGGVFETGLRTEEIKELPTGTIVSWIKGKLHASISKRDTLVQGVVKNGKAEPVVMGAEPILMTGKIKAGDYIMTSNKEGHGMKYKSPKKYLLISHHIPGTIIAQALEDGEGESYTIKAMIRKF